MGATRWRSTPKPIHESGGIDPVTIPIRWLCRIILLGWAKDEIEFTWLRNHDTQITTWVLRTATCIQRVTTIKGVIILQRSLCEMIAAPESG